MSADTQTPPPAPASELKPITPLPDAAERLRAIAERQDTQGKATFDALFGAGAHLWESDAEFEQFLQLIREARGKE